jgi:FtsP/CotA-like multicopper oxidase with cupredoxin domain
MYRDAMTQPPTTVTLEPPATAPTGNVVEVNLEARECDWVIAPGKVVRAWGYNGAVPGPTIEASAGDTVVVRLKNNLPEPTTIHWHGIRLPVPMDGTESVQAPVAPGETFEYRFEVPDAGTFWYHSHSNETVQVERGLYGALVVRAHDEPVFDRERLLVLDDLRLNRHGEIAAPGGWLERHNGRQGKTLLINGLNQPVITMHAGQIERWRIINAASARYYRFSIDGRPLHIIGTDGGLIERPVPVNEVLLVPGDRVELAVGPFDEDTTMDLVSLPYNRMAGPSRRERLGTLNVGPKRESISRMPEHLRTIQPIADADAVPGREVHLGVGPSLRHGLNFLINGEQHHHDNPVRVGELQVWDIVNDSMMDHPFHLHGFFFQVLSVDGVVPDYISWEDTVNIPPKGRVRIAWMPDDRPGRWMYHCHILEHHAAGMMAHVDVVN